MLLSVIGKLRVAPHHSSHGDAADRPGRAITRCWLERRTALALSVAVAVSQIGARRSLATTPLLIRTVRRSLSLFESPASAVRDFGALELHADPQVVERDRFPVPRVLQHPRQRRG